LRAADHGRFQINVEKRRETRKAEGEKKAANNAMRKASHDRDKLGAVSQGSGAGGGAPVYAAAAMDIAFNSPPPTRNQGKIIIFTRVAFLFLKSVYYYSVHE